MAGKGSFAYRGADDDMPPEQRAAELEHQQAVLMGVLRERRGMGASFAELQEAGIEFPASVVSELELSGVPIERCVLRAHRASTVGVRLDHRWLGPPPTQRARLADERPAVRRTVVRRTVGKRHESHDRLSPALVRYRKARRLIVEWLQAIREMLATIVVNLRDGPLRDMRARIAAVPWGAMWSRIRATRWSDTRARIPSAQGSDIRARIAAARRSDMRMGIPAARLSDMRARVPVTRWNDARASIATALASCAGASNAAIRWMAHNKRLLAPAALLAVFAVTIALVVAHVNADVQHTGPPARAHTHHRTHAAGSGASSSALAAGSTHASGSGNAAGSADAAGSANAAGSADAAGSANAAGSPSATGSAQTVTPVHPGRTPPPAHVPVSPQLAAELQLRGHDLMGAGEYGHATRLLSKALAASGESVQNCLQPVSEACLTYAYALYDLGRALMLSGSPAAAVPVLERRLQIEDQRAIVANTLEQARAQMG